MSWQDIVGNQLAHQMGAAALARAARGEDYDEVALEGPRLVSGYVDEGQGPRRIDGRGEQRQLSGGHDNGPRPLVANGGGPMVRAFCMEVAGRLGRAGYNVDPGAVARVLGEMAQGGWEIDVEQRR